MQRIFLFDVDGTLVDAGGAGRVAMSRAFGEVCGHQGALEGFSFAGMTDRGLVREGFRRSEKPYDDAGFQRLVDAYLLHLASCLEQNESIRVLAPVPRLVEECNAVGAVGLGTGNVEAGARLKLGRAGLSGLFGFGGFGDDAEDRAEMLEHGVLRGCQHLGIAREDADVLVIGDTPRDVSAAHAIGGRCLAVTTGHFEHEALSVAGADQVVASLDSPEARAMLLHSLG